MHRYLIYITLAALVLHFTLGIGGHRVCAASRAAHDEHEHHEHHHADDCQRAPGNSAPDGRTCDAASCSLLVPATGSLAKLAPADGLWVATMAQTITGCEVVGKPLGLEPGPRALPALRRLQVLTI